MSLFDILSTYFSPITILWAFMLSGIIYFVFSFFILRFIGLYYHKQQGGAIRFNWKLIPIIDDFRNAYKRGDYCYNLKETIRQNPKSRFIAMNFGPWDYLILTDPKMIKEMLQKYELYQKDKKFFGLLLELFAKSLVFVEGVEWKKRRKIISSAFNFDFLKHTVPLIAEFCQEKFNEWIQAGNLEKFSLCDHMGTITGEVTGRFLFGWRFGKQSMDGKPLTIFTQQLLNDIAFEVFSLPMILFGKGFVKAGILPRHRKMNKNIAELRKRCQEIIEATKKSVKKEENLLSMLLKLHCAKAYFSTTLSFASNFKSKIFYKII